MVMNQGRMLPHTSMQNLWLKSSISCVFWEFLSLSKMGKGMLYQDLIFDFIELEPEACSLDQCPSTNMLMHLVYFN